MQETIDAAPEVVTQAKSHIERRSERLLHLFSFVPNDKLTWAPSSTAKSPLRIVAHCALTSRFFARVITDKMPGSMPSPAEFFQELGQAAEKITTRESAVALMSETTSELCIAIDTVNAENINATKNSPFGPMPVQFWISQGSDHIAGHTGQLEYMQTIWGDLDNHLG